MSRTPRSIILHPHLSMLDRFWKKVDKEGPVSVFRPDLGPCWIWISSRTPIGYGRFHTGRAVAKAHQIAYELLFGPIPKGKELDHLCRVPFCVNPAHLEAVTHKENMRRSDMTKFNAFVAEKRAQTHCQRGHEFNNKNTYWHRGKRACNECRRMAVKRWREKK